LIKIGVMQNAMILLHPLLDSNPIEHFLHILCHLCHIDFSFWVQYQENFVENAFNAHGHIPAEDIQKPLPWKQYLFQWIRFPPMPSITQIN
jgi:hypothetical protein